MEVKRLSAFITSRRCVLYQNGRRFVWKRKAFCIKTWGVLYQNGKRFLNMERECLECLI